MAVVVPDGDEGLEAGALTGAGLLLHGHDLEHVVLEGGPEEEVDDLELLKGIEICLSSKTKFREQIVQRRRRIRTQINFTWFYQKTVV